MTNDVKRILAEGARKLVEKNNGDIAAAKGELVGRKMKRAPVEPIYDIYLRGILDALEDMEKKLKA